MSIEMTRPKDEKTIKRMKRIASTALHHAFGYRPRMNEFWIMSAGEDSTHCSIEFVVGMKTYMFQSFKMNDGSVWIGTGSMLSMTKGNVKEVQI